MKQINKLMTENKAGLKTMPQDLQVELEEFKKAVSDYNVACGEVEEDDEETIKELDEKEAHIKEWEKALVAKMKEYFEKAKADAAAEPAPPAPAPTPKEEKKDNSVGWLIFAGVVFAATLGAVNMMKKRA